MADKPDLIIIGGGPAGAATAIALARAGRKVVLCEARNFKQSQMSDLKTGEVLSPGAQRELAHLGFPCAVDAPWRLDDFAVLRQFWSERRVTRHPLPKQLCYWQSDRGVFDKALLDFAAQAGVEVKLGFRVAGIIRDGDLVGGVRQQDGTTLEVPLVAPLVVDASGRRSPLLARLDLKRPDPEFQRLALVCFFSDVPDTANGEWEQHFLGAFNTTLNGSRMKAGLYRFTLETDLKVKERFSNLHRPLELFLAILQEARPALAARFRAATPLSYAIAYAPIAYQVPKIVHQGLVMVGDAAGYLDPATGQGIEFALRMARLAAGVLDRAIQQQSYNPEDFRSYELELKKEISYIKRDLRLYLRVTRRRRLLNLLSRVRPLRYLVVRRMVTPR